MGVVRQLCRNTVLAVTIMLVLYDSHVDCAPFLSIDQEIEDLTWAEGNDTEEKILHDQETELDMLLTPQQIIQHGNLISADKSEPLTVKSDLWPQGRIPFSVGYKFDNHQIMNILKAMDAWSKYTCLKFEAKTPNDEDFVKIYDGPMCNSNVGRIGGHQSMSLSQPCAERDEIILHVLGHLIGLFHLHNRVDRDKYIKIHWENMAARNRDGYNKLANLYDSTHGVPYDYRSIMHYGRKSFTENYEETITPLNSKYHYIIGMAKHLSFGDIKTVNLMYQCSLQCPHNIDCPDEGFLGQDCRCYCPDNDGADIIVCPNILKEVSIDSLETTGDFSEKANDEMLLPDDENGIGLPDDDSEILGDEKEIPFFLKTSEDDTKVSDMGIPGDGLDLKDESGAFDTILTKDESSETDDEHPLITEAELNLPKINGETPGDFDNVFSKTSAKACQDAQSTVHFCETWKILCNMSDKVALICPKTCGLC